MMGNLLGLGIWFGGLLLSVLESAVKLVWLIGRAIYVLVSPPGMRWPTYVAGWRVLLITLAEPVANLLMPLAIFWWPSLPAWLQYLLNTPDDPYPPTQGWAGKNKEPQVIWVHDHCGAFWTRVYWLQRNCLYGLAVKLRGPRIDFASVRYLTIPGESVFTIFATWAYRETTDHGLQLRVWTFPLFGRFLVVYFGWALWRYLDKLNPPKPNSAPELDASKDMGGVPVLTARLQKTNPLAPLA